MIGGGHFRAAKGLGDFPNAGVVGGDDHFAEGLGLLTALDDVLDERLAGDQGQRLAGEAGRAVTRGNDADDVHVSRKIQAAAAGRSSTTTAAFSWARCVRSNSRP